MATRYKDRITILEDAEIEELYGRPRFAHDERVHYFALKPEERATLGAKADQVVRISAKPIYVFPGSGAIPGNPQSGRPGLQLSTGRRQPRARQRARAG